MNIFIKDENNYTKEYKFKFTIENLNDIEQVFNNTIENLINEGCIGLFPRFFFYYAVKKPSFDSPDEVYDFIDLLKEKNININNLILKILIESGVIPKANTTNDDSEKVNEVKETQQQFLTKKQKELANKSWNSISDYLNNYLKQEILACGIKPNEYLQMTVSECKDVIEAYSTKTELDRRVRADMDNRACNYLVACINKMLSGKGDIPDFYVLYGDCFGWDKEDIDNFKKYKQQKELQNSLMAMINQFNTKMDLKEKERIDKEKNKEFMDNIEKGLVKND